MCHCHCATDGSSVLDVSVRVREHRTLSHVFLIDFLAYWSSRDLFSLIFSKKYSLKLSAKFGRLSKDCVPLQHAARAWKQLKCACLSDLQKDTWCTIFYSQTAPPFWGFLWASCGFLSSGAKPSHHDRLLCTRLWDSRSISCTQWKNVTNYLKRQWPRLHLFCKIY